MLVDAEEKRRIIDLYFNQGKTIREVCRIVGRSSHDIIPVTKEHRIWLAKNYTIADGENTDVVQHQQEIVIPNVKAYKLFDEGKSPLEVAAELTFQGLKCSIIMLNTGFEENGQACLNISRNSR